jgi:hypothetical protein
VRIQILIAVGTVTAKLGIEVGPNVISAGIVLWLTFFYRLLMVPVIMEFVGLGVSIPRIIKGVNIIVWLWITCPYRVMTETH